MKERSEKYAGPGKKKAGLLGAFGYVDKAKFDEVNQDDTDESDEDKKSRKKSIVTESGTVIVKDEKLESMKSQIQKLGPTATAFTVFKSYVATGVLYMPNQFYVSGWLFTAITLMISLVMNLYSCKLLLEVHDKTGGSLPDIGFAAFGKVGKITCDILLVCSQFGFCTAYVYFIAS